MVKLYYTVCRCRKRLQRYHSASLGRTVALSAAPRLDEPAATAGTDVGKVAWWPLSKEEGDAGLASREEDFLPVPPEDFLHVGSEGTLGDGSDGAR